MKVVNEDKILFKSMDNNKNNIIQSNLQNKNPLQFVSIPNLNNINIINKDMLISNYQIQNNNDISNSNIKNLNISESEEYGFELDQSSESIMNNNRNMSQILMNNNLNSPTKNDYSVCITMPDYQKNTKINKNNNYNPINIANNENLVTKLISEKKLLEENLRNEHLINQEQKNYIEVLKQTINNSLIKSGIKNTIESSANEVKKTPKDFLIEYNNLKCENEKMKKQMIMQGILYEDIKNELDKLKEENINLNNINENLNKENKKLNLKDGEIKLNYEKLVEESSLIKNELEKYEGEFLNCQKNNKDYENLKQKNEELKTNFENQKSMLNNLQNDFGKLTKNHAELSKYNEKLIKENQQLKREIYLNSNELLNINNKLKSDLNDYNFSNEKLLTEKNAIINEYNLLKNENSKLNEIIQNQKIENESLNKVLDEKNQEILKMLRNFQNFGKLEDDKKKNENTKGENGDFDFLNFKNELQNKNDIISDLKSQNEKLNKECELKDEKIQKLLNTEKINNKKFLDKNEEKKYLEQLEKLTTIIKQKEIDIYSFKKNEKTYNKIVDASFETMKDFISEIQTFDEFKNLETNTNNDLFIKPLKEFISVINQNNYKGTSNISLIEKIKKLNEFINIIPIQLTIFYQKIKSLLKENETLLNIKQNNTKINQSTISNIFINGQQNNNNNDTINFNNNFFEENSIVYKSNISPLRTTNTSLIQPLRNLTTNRVKQEINESNLANKNMSFTNIKTHNNHINNRVKELNDLINNSVNNKSLFDNNNNLIKKEEITFGNNINNNNNDSFNNTNNDNNNCKSMKKSKLTLFKEEISNKIKLNNSKYNLSLNKNKNSNLIFPVKTTPGTFDDSNNSQYKTFEYYNKNNNNNSINNISNSNSNKNLFKFSKPNSTRTINFSRISDNNNNNETKNIPSTSKDVGRKYNNIFAKAKKNKEGFDIDELTDEVMKPTFLISDVGFSLLNSSANNNDSFLFKNNKRNNVGFIGKDNGNNKKAY